MPDPSSGDPRRLVLIIVAAAFLVGWVTIGSTIGYHRIPGTFIGAMIAFDLAVLCFIWRIMRPRG